MNDQFERKTIRSPGNVCAACKTQVRGESRSESFRKLREHLGRPRYAVTFASSIKSSSWNPQLSIVESAVVGMQCKALRRGIVILFPGVATQ